MAKKQLSVRVAEDIFQRIEEIANLTGRMRSEVAEELLSKALGEMPPTTVEGQFAALVQKFEELQAEVSTLKKTSLVTSGVY
jgi:predicted DNA-binding protein